MIQKNRQQQRKDLGINKRGIHNPAKKHRGLLIVNGKDKYRLYSQTIIDKKTGRKIKITHTDFK